MLGNGHARFLEGDAAVTPLPYSALSINVVRHNRPKMLSGRSQNGNAAGAGAAQSPAMGKGVLLSTLPANRESLNRSCPLGGTW